MIDQKKEWLAAFRKTYNRNPTLEEVTEASKHNFQVDSDTESANENDYHDIENKVSDTAIEWKNNFVQNNGRQPNIEELKEAKSNNFSNVNSSVSDKVIDYPKKQLSKKNRWLISALLIVLGILIALYSWGNHYYSQGETAKRVIKVLKSGNSKTYADNFVWSDTKKSINKKDVMPFVNSMPSKWSANQENDIYSQLLSQKDDNGFVFKQTGSNFFIFPKYQLEINPVNLSVTTNNKGIQLEMNGESIGESDSDTYTKQLNHQASGLYKFKATGNVSGQNVSANDSRMIMTNDDINLSINMISFDVNSNLTSGDLYVGGKKVGTLNDGLLKVNKMPISKGAKAYVQSNFNGTVVRSEKMNLSDLYDGESINLDADGLMTKNDANSTINSMYSALSSYASNESDSNDLTMFKNGANNKSYQDYKQMIKHNLHDAKRNAQSVSFNSPEVQSVNQTGLNTADAVYQVKTDFYYSSSSDNDGDTSGDLTQTFELTAHMMYDKQSKTWQIDSIDSNQKKISEDNNVK